MRRLKEIKDRNKNYKVIPMDLELQLNTKYSYDTINILKQRFPQVNFFWIIGADNLLIMHKWYNWKKLFYMCPIVVFDRPNYFYKSICTKENIKELTGKSEFEFVCDTANTYHCGSFCVSNTRLVLAFRYVSENPLYDLSEWSKKFDLINSR